MVRPLASSIGSLQARSRDTSLMAFTGLRSEKSFVMKPSSIICSTSDVVPIFK
jgi:hypothetical protein